MANKSLCFLFIIQAIVFFSPVSACLAEEASPQQQEVALQQQEAALRQQEAVEIEKYPSKSLVQIAWECYNAKQYDAALSNAERCIALYDTYAKKQQASLKEPIPTNKIHFYWMLNDVATAKFIKGKVLWEKKDRDGAKAAMNDVADNYGYAMAYDRRGWFWSVSGAARDAIRGMELGIDFGDSASNLLTTKAWEAYEKKDYQAALGFAEHCIRMYKDTAIWQQKSLSRYPKKENIHLYWALNDVGTCCFIAGKSCRMLGQRAKAKEYFTLLEKQLYYASCWDPKGWYWRVVDAPR